MSVGGQAASDERKGLVNMDAVSLLREELREAHNLLEAVMVAVVTVLALPINIIAALLGMNVGGLPLAQHPDGFWIVAMFTVVAGWLAYRKMRE